MNINDKIEKRALNRVQINHILDVLINNKHNEKNYYNFRNTYSVQTIDGTNYLYENQENKRMKIKRRILMLVESSHLRICLTFA